SFRATLSPTSQGVPMIRLLTRGLAPAVFLVLSSCATPNPSMTAQTTHRSRPTQATSVPAEGKHLFLLEDLDDANQTTGLAEGDRAALAAIAEWIRTFVVMPHKDLGRAGPVCPFVPGARERRTLWLA